MFGFTNYSFPLYRNYNRYNRYSTNSPFMNPNMRRLNNSNFYKQTINSGNCNINNLQNQWSQGNGYSNSYENSQKLADSNSCENFDKSSRLSSCSCSASEKIEDGNSKTEFLDLFGIKLYFDDLIIISLLYFLYTEGVNDYYLFITLILLLLS